MSELKYLQDVVQNLESFAIEKACVSAGLNVIGRDERKVTVKAGCLPVDISWETCSCHGGRIWLEQQQTGIHVELSSPEYDEDKGIIDPYTELAWRIEHELADAVKDFERYIYVVDTYGNYGTPDRHERRYFKSPERAARFMFEEDGHDPLTTDSVVHKYPNPKMELRIRYDGDTPERNGSARRARYRGVKINYDDHGNPRTDYEYMIEYWVYRKGLR